MFNQDFIAELAAAVAEKVIHQIAGDVKQTTTTERAKISGIKGIAEYLHCSTRTAQKLKDQGLFPTYWIGKNLYAYSDEVEAGIKKTGRV